MCCLPQKNTPCETFIWIMLSWQVNLGITERVTLVLSMHMVCLLKHLSCLLVEGLYIYQWQSCVLCLISLGFSQFSCLLFQEYIVLKYWTCLIGFLILRLFLSYSVNYLFLTYCPTLNNFCDIIFQTLN